MVDFVKHISRIEAHGVSFRVESEEPVTEIQRRTIADSFNRFPRRIVQILGEGREGESPLRIVVAKKENWFQYARTFFSKESIPYTIKSVPKGIDIFGLYSWSENTIFLRPETTNLSHQFDVVHEIAHAVDDFAVSKSLYPGFLNIERAAAADLLISDQFINDHKKWIFGYMAQQYSASIAHNGADLKTELFAATVEKLFIRFDFRKNPFPGKGPYKIYVGTLEKEMETEILSFFQSVWLFLENYPGCLDRQTIESYSMETLCLPAICTTWSGVMTELNRVNQANPPWVP